MSLKDAAATVAEAYGLPRRKVYQAALEMEKDAKCSARKVSYLAGLAAEDAVAADYARRGHPVAARRWRGSRGEIDLVLRDGDGLIFVEVKQARDFARALAAADPRPSSPASTAPPREFVASEPRGQLTELRFDVALVDGTGRIEIYENFWA